MLFYFLLVLFSRIISKFFVLTIDNIHHGQTKSQHYIAGWSSEKVSRRGVAFHMCVCFGGGREIFLGEGCWDLLCDIDLPAILFTWRL